MIEEKTIPEKVKAWLEIHQKGTVAEIAQAIGAKPNATGTALHRLKKHEGSVYKVSRGMYALARSITVHERAAQHSSEAQISGQESSAGIYDLESTETILYLKKKYGRERLLELLEKIKELVE